MLAFFGIWNWSWHFLVIFWHCMLTFFWHLELAVAFFETYFPIRDLGVGLKDENMMMKKKDEAKSFDERGIALPLVSSIFQE